MTPVEFSETAQVYQLLSELDPRHVVKLLPLATEAVFIREQIIFPQRAKSEYLYLIVNGTVALEAVTTGSPLRIQTLHAGEALGWSALAESGRTHFQARAVSQVEAIAFRGTELRKICESDPALGYAFMQCILGVVTERLDATRRQL